MSAELTQERPERRPHEYYSPERKAEILSLLDANNGNTLKTANQSGISHTTIQYWELNRHRFDELRQEKQADLASRMENAANYALDLAQTKAPDASYAQLMTGAAIAIDKMQLLRNQPTSITQHVNSESLTVVLAQVLNEITTSTEQG
jgi:hypothetical protein